MDSTNKDPSELIKLFAKNQLIATCENQLKDDNSNNNSLLKKINIQIYRSELQLDSFRKHKAALESEIITNTNLLEKARSEFEVNTTELKTHLSLYSNPDYVLSLESLIIRVVLEFIKRQWLVFRNQKIRWHAFPYAPVVWKLAIADKHHLMLVNQYFCNSFTYSIAAQIVDPNWWFRKVQNIFSSVDKRKRQIEKEINDKIRHKNHNPKRVQELKQKLEELNRSVAIKYDDRILGIWEKYLGSLDRIRSEHLKLQLVGQDCCIATCV
jgi:hypothetical protein